jgi:MFS family permease
VRRRLRDAAGALASSLADRRLRRVQLAWGATITSEWVIIVSLAVWAFAEGGAIGIGVVTLARTLPAAVLGPFLAPLTDRYRRDRILTLVNAGRFVLVGSVAAALVGGAPMVLVYALAAMDATIYTLYWPAQSSLLAELARRPEELVAANVASTTLENVGALGGPALAALLLGFVAPGPTVAVAAALQLVAVATVLGLARDGRADAAPTSEVAEPSAGHLAGFRHLARTPRPRLVAGLYLCYTLAGGGLTVLVAVLALEGLGLGEPGVGLLTAAMGAGGVAGSVAALGLVGHPRLAGALATGVLVWAVATAALGPVPTVAVALALLVVTGTCNALVDVAALTLLQRLVPVHLLGRVLGVVEGVWWATLGVGGFAASVLARAVGVELALGIVGGALAVLAAAAHRSLRAVDAAVLVPRDHLDVLLRDPILGPLPTVEIERLAAAAELRTVPGDEVVIRLGDPGDHYFLIAAGRVEATGPGVQRRMGPGEGFGEIALLRGSPRTATVRTLEPTTLLAVGRDGFLAAVGSHRPSAAAATGTATERLES